MNKECYNKSIEEHLKEVEYLIEQNKYLQKKYPDHANSLKIGLQSLEELQKEMIIQIDRRLI